MKRFVLPCLWAWMSVLGGCGQPPVPDDEPICVEGRFFARPVAGGSCQRYQWSCDVPEDAVLCCGGLAFGGCPASLSCEDDPLDACESGQTSDCPGICQ
ncbi:hypothetical protein [Cystobacter ferrugineus]|uniref:Lipoprotein n=1 Tax=Cystobacter ferrugineus TaxID=83449 RepID=A0A1L9BGI7_9BACT|nr:hypothetical protein [Cystobacter ferrugineus]OJH41308.1 hypothetical protein BON30_10575 [Cystobacter ferrugineus]